MTKSQREARKSGNRSPLKGVPMDRWVTLDSLTSDQVQAVIDGPVSCEWHAGIDRNSREVMEVRITAKP